MAVLMRSLLASHVDYGDFVGVIPNSPKFTPSDLDGIAERNGKFFVMEWKRPKEKVSTGQRIMLQALAGKADFIVVIVIGDTDNGMKIEEFFLSATAWVMYQNWYIQARIYSVLQTMV